MKFIRDVFTEADGVTWDLGRLQWFVGTVVFFALSGFAYMIRGQVFDPVAWSTGFAGSLVAGGGMVWMKSKEKP